jgi:hypothetical protein
MIADYKLTHDCRRPALMKMDYRRDGVSFVNRHCITCNAHWYGPEDQVKEFTSKEWDQYLESDTEQGEPK